MSQHDTLTLEPCPFCGRHVEHVSRAATPTPPAQQPESVPSEQSGWCVYVAGMVAGWLGMDVDDPKIPTMGAIIERRLWALKRDTPPAQAAADARDAERYRALKARHSYLIVCRLIGESGYSSHKASKIIDAYADSAVSDVRAHDSMTPEQRQQELQDEFDAALSTHQQGGK